MTQEQKNDALFDAVEKGDFEISRLHLYFGAEVNAKDSEKNTPLHIAAYKSFLDLKYETDSRSQIVRILLEHGADVNAVNMYNETALNATAISGNIDVAAMLLKAGADINLDNLNRHGDSLLHAAITAEENKMAKFLLENGVNTDIKNSKGKTPLEAAEAKDRKKIADLIRCHVEHKNSKNNPEETEVIEEGYVKVEHNVNNLKSAVDGLTIASNKELVPSNTRPAPDLEKKNPKKLKP